MNKPAILTTAVRPETGATIRDLLDGVNAAGRAARTASIVLLALALYFFIALGGLIHRQLLLDAPLILPIFNVSVSLARFFLFAPLLFIFVHLAVLILYASLARRAYALAGALEMQEITERATTGKAATHMLRYATGGNFFTQLVAGPPESELVAFFQQFILWITLVFLPIALLLAFQISFLPFHDVAAAWVHRSYLAADVAFIASVGVFLPSGKPDYWEALWQGLVRFSGLYLVTALVLAASLIFAFCIATVPGEWIDRELARSNFSMTVSSAGEQKPEEAARPVFTPTALLFELPGSLFHRNLIVMDQRFDKSETLSLSLRNRDLRYARLDRSDLREIDLTCADLTGAVLEGAKLDEAKTGCPSR